MPLPPELLEKIKATLDEAEKNIKSIEDVIADLRASGIDASKQEETLSSAKDRFKLMRLFYSKQEKRIGG